MPKLMWKRMLCSVALAGISSLPAHAQTQPGATTVEFAFHGFTDASTGVFNPSLWISGSFTGTDANGDGWIQQDELTHFSWNGLDYTPGLYGYGAGCGDFVYCELVGFSYQLHGQPSFYTYFNSWDGHVSLDGSTYSGDRIILVAQPGGAGSYTWLWSDGTQYGVSPLPEPAAAPMLLAGLACGGVLGLLRRRRARRQPLERLG